MIEANRIIGRQKIWPSAMTEYHRAWFPGGTWLCTVNLAERRGSRLLVERIDVLRPAFRSVR